MSTLAALFQQPPPSSSPTLILPPSALSSSASNNNNNNYLTLPFSTYSSALHAFRSRLNSTGLLPPGSTVSLSLGNSLEFAIAFLAVANNRCVAAPLNPAYNEHEVDFYLSDSQSKLLLVHRLGGEGESPAANKKGTDEAIKSARKAGIEVAEVWWEGEGEKVDLKLRLLGKKGEVKVGRTAEGGEPREDDVALLLHTSGTTGRPKAVPLTHVNLSTTIKNIIRTYDLTPSDRSFLVMPLFHVHGLLAGFLAPLYAGSCVVIPPRFSARSFWAELGATHCTYYTAVPTIHQILLSSEKPKSIPKLRFIRSCSSALSPTTFRELEKAFGAPVLEAYAMTEAAHQMTSNPLPPLPRKPGTVGLGQGVEIAILDDAGKQVAQGEEGEVSIRGANVTKGYLNNDKANKESFTKEGYFRTGDRGKKDRDGYVVLTGRIKELINRGGEKISPLEVDAALLSVEGVAEAVAFGVPDEKYGEVVWAAVVIKEAAKGKVGEKEVVKGAGSKISKFKVPVRVFLVDSIPKTATGKIQRRNVSTTFQKRAEEEDKGKKAKAKL